MRLLRSEHLRPRRFIRYLATGVLASLIVAVPVSGALAVDPPQPDFFWPYGTVQVDGANVSPAEQPVIALVNGKVCGEATTLIAAAGPGVPPDDVGKTVYVVDVLADGAATGQRAGCGRSGDTVLLYFPASRRIALQQLVFFSGGQRANVDLGSELQYRLQGPMVANDGVN